jgi:hypothetical protein
MEHAANNDHLKDDQIKKTEEENLKIESPIPDQEPEVKESVEPLKEDAPELDSIPSDITENEIADAVDDESSEVSELSTDSEVIAKVDQTETPEIETPDTTEKEKSALSEVDSAEVPESSEAKAEPSEEASAEVPELSEAKAEPSEEASAEVPVSSEAKAEPVFPKEVEKVDYETLNREELVKALDELLANPSFEKIKRSIDEIHDHYSVKSDAELAVKKTNFISEGGLEQDFKPADDPVNRHMNGLLEKYKGLKADFNKSLEEKKEINLATKQEILEEFRLLMDGQEGFDNTFRKFKQLQTRWFEVGIIPKQNLKDLWNSYNYFVDKFNDYVNINRELRVLDLKKNLTLKTELCVKAEELSSDTNVSNAFKTLQKLHTSWREIGPVPREDKDSIWERFKIATSSVNRAHQSFQMELKDSLVANLELKKGLCEKVEEIAVNTFSDHKEWVNFTKQVLDLQKEWKTIGYAPKKENNLIYARFRKACDEFFEKKAAFYSETFEHQKKNLEMKREIVEAAEEVKDSTDWKRTTDSLIELQKKWKDVGPVPRKDSDKLWKRFRIACDHFFHNKSEHFGGKNESYDDNLKAKDALIAEMIAYKASDDHKAILTDIDVFQNRFNEIGFVPVEAKDRIREAFKEAQNTIISKLEVDESEKSLMRFRIKVSSMSGNPKADNKLHFEREKLLTRLQQSKSDIGVWENNIGFFKQTKTSEDTLADFKTKIEEARSRIVLLEKKIRIIDKWEDEQ